MCLASSSSALGLTLLVDAVLFTAGVVLVVVVVGLDGGGWGCWVGCWVGVLVFGLGLGLTASELSVQFPILLNLVSVYNKSKTVNRIYRGKGI